MEKSASFEKHSKYTFGVPNSYTKRLCTRAEAAILYYNARFRKKQVKFAQKQSQTRAKPKLRQASPCEQGGLPQGCGH